MNVIIAAALLWVVLFVAGCFHTWYSNKHRWIVIYMAVGFTLVGGAGYLTIV